MKKIALRDTCVWGKGVSGGQVSVLWTTATCQKTWLGEPVETVRAHFHLLEKHL